MNDEMHYLRDQYDDACRRIRQLTSGPGGIMEMKQTIADKEKRIDKLESAIRKALDGNHGYDIAIWRLKTAMEDE